MNHDEFAKFILDLVGGIPGIEFRPLYADLLKRRGFDVWIRWEWIKDRSVLAKVDGTIMDMIDGMEWVKIFVYEDQRAST